MNSYGRSKTAMDGLWITVDGNGRERTIIYGQTAANAGSGSVRKVSPRATLVGGRVSRRSREGWRAAVLEGLGVSKRGPADKREEAR